MRITNKMFVLWLLLCLTSSVLPFSSSCNRGTTSGITILSSIQGEVLLRRAGTVDWIKGELNMTLKAGDAIKSGSEANAMITFFDGSTVELIANTQLEVTELVKKQATIIRLKQEIGDTISKVEKLVDPASRYEIETPAAVVGVRGSSMRVSVAQDGATTVQNLEGQISVTAQGVELIIPEQGTGAVKPGEPPVLELSYDDGESDGGYSTGGFDKQGFLVRFDPPVAQFQITKVRIYSWIIGTPIESDEFTVRITDKVLSPLWETSLPFSLFTNNKSWLEVDVPDTIINDSFCIQLYAPTLGQGLGPYIGIDKSVVNEYSELLNGWKIVAWTLAMPKTQTNWMIRVNGNNITSSEP